jgi:hypothetical protein
MRAWAAGSGKKPSKEVPEGLIARRQACVEAGESAAAASARERSSNELDAARAGLADAERSASEAALLIVLEEAERVAARLDAAHREVWHLASQLHRLGQLWLPTGTNKSPKPVRLSPQVQAALFAKEPQYPPSMRPEVKQSAAWRSYHAALLADPEATFDAATKSVPEKT